MHLQPHVSQNTIIPHLKSQTCISVYVLTYIYFRQKICSKLLVQAYFKIVMYIKGHILMFKKLCPRRVTLYKLLNIPYMVNLATITKHMILAALFLFHLT